MDALNKPVHTSLTTVCMYCGKTRGEKGWQRTEHPRRPSSTQFLSHSACPKCLLEALPALEDEIRQELGWSPEV